MLTRERVPFSFDSNEDSVPDGTFTGRSLGTLSCPVTLTAHYKDRIFSEEIVFDVSHQPFRVAPVWMTQDD